MGLFGRDLERAANLGRPLSLQCGVDLVVRASSLRSLARLQRDIPAGLDVAVDPVSVGSSDLKRLVGFILAESNPEAVISAEWVAEHVTPAEAVEIVRVWQTENALGEMIERLRGHAEEPESDEERPDAFVGGLPAWFARLFGWTLDETLDLTLPQIVGLMEDLQRDQAKSEAERQPLRDPGDRRVTTIDFRKDPDGALSALENLGFGVKH